MVRKTFLPVIVVVALVAFVIGCSQNGHIKPYSEMTPKEKATFMMSVYNKQYEDYLVQVKRDDLTEEQKEILVTKKQVLTEIYPLIQLYTEYVDSGAVPTDDTEERILDYIDRLAMLAVR